MFLRDDSKTKPVNLYNYSTTNRVYSQPVYVSQSVFPHGQLFVVVIVVVIVVVVLRISFIV